MRLGNLPNPYKISTFGSSLALVDLLSLRFCAPKHRSWSGSYFVSVLSLSCSRGDSDLSVREMANQSEDSSVPSAQIVGNAFIQQFYVALHKSPEQVHKFYLDSSVLSRPGADGALTLATTIQGINEMILSLDHQNYHTEIVTADAQFSYKDGVIVLVTGCLNGNNVRRKFTQSFFLFPQDKRYYVLNDIFRYVDDETSNDPDGSSSTLPLIPSIESTEIADQPIPNQTVSLELEDTNDGNEVIRALDNGKESVAEEISVVEENGITENKVTAEKPADLSQNVAPPVPEAAAPLQETASLQEAAPLQEDAPKKSFASVVYALNKNMAPFHVRAAPPKPVEQQPRAPAVPEPPAPSTNNVVESTNDLAATAKAFAIFVANLPMSATVEELDKVFKEFGPIKRDGIQVRSNKGTCFGFVEFESSSAMQNALEASPIVFGNRKLSIEERRANNDRGRFSSGRSGYRSDNFRGRGSRGYGRNEFEKRGEFSGCARANSGHNNGEPQQRAYPNGGGKVARQAVQVA